MACARAFENRFLMPRYYPWVDIDTSSDLVLFNSCTSSQYLQKLHQPLLWQLPKTWWWCWGLHRLKGQVGGHWSNYNTYKCHGAFHIWVLHPKCYSWSDSNDCRSPHHVYTLNPHPPSQCLQQSILLQPLINLISIVYCIHAFITTTTERLQLWKGIITWYKGYEGKHPATIHYLQKLTNHIINTTTNIIRRGSVFTSPQSMLSMLG